MTGEVGRKLLVPGWVCENCLRVGNSLQLKHHRIVGIRGIAADAFDLPWGFP